MPLKFENLVIAVLISAQVVTRTWSFQNSVLHTSTPYNPYVPLKTPFLQRNPSGSTWQFSNNAGVPTWVITTTVIETRNETSNATTNKDEDSPVGPNLREDAMMAANENEDPDIEFPIRDGKDPAVHARPAFGDPDKYEETTSAPKPEKTVNKTRPLITVNRTTVVKIEFHNTPFLPLVLNVGNAASEPENKNDTTALTQAPQSYAGPREAQGQPASPLANPIPSSTRSQTGGKPIPSAEYESSSQAAKIDRAGLSPGSTYQVAPKQIVPDVQFPSYVPYEGAQLPPWSAQIPQAGVIYPYARFWRKK